MKKVDDAGSSVRAFGRRWHCAGDSPGDERAGGGLLANPRVGNAVFWIVGAVVAVLIGLTGLAGDSSSLHRLSAVPAYLYLAGALAAILVFVIAWLIPRIGAGLAMATMLAGQVIAGLVISQYGWLGSPVQPING